MKKISLFTFGLLVSFLLLELGLRLGSYIYVSLQEFRNRKAISGEGTYRIMCLGDSVTVVGGEHAYPFQLEKILNKRQDKINFSVVNKGVTGATTGIILSQLEKNINKYRPHMIMIMAGLTDGWRRLPYGNIPVDGKSRLKIFRLARLFWHNILSRFSEDNFLKEIKNENNQTQKYLKSAEYFKAHAQYDKTVEFLKKAIERKPLNDEGYFLLGKMYMELGEFSKGEILLEKAIKKRIASSKIYFILGLIYEEQDKFKDAEEMLIRALEINPADTQAYLALGMMYLEKEEYDKSEEILKKGIVIKPHAWELYLMLAMIYRKKGEFDKLREILESKAGNNSEVLCELGWFYMDREEYDKAVDVFIQLLNMDSLRRKIRDREIYNNLSFLYREQGEDKLSEEFFRKAEEINIGEDTLSTSSNYKRFKEIAEKNRIQLVAIQYPMRGIAPLMKMFLSNEGVVFVDNERIFKNAVAADSYWKYFIDSSNGDFGHLTKQGHILLAQNLADILLKEYFKIYNKNK